MYREHKSDGIIPLPCCQSDLKIGDTVEVYTSKIRKTKRTQLVLSHRKLVLPALGIALMLLWKRRNYQGLIKCRTKGGDDRRRSGIEAFCRVQIDVKPIRATMMYSLKNNGIQSC